MKQAAPAFRHNPLALIQKFSSPHTVTFLAPILLVCYTSILLEILPSGKYRGCLAKKNNNLFDFWILMNSNPHIEKPEGIYSNCFRIGHNIDVIVIDHYQIFPEDNETNTEMMTSPNHKVRIIITPSDAKQLMEQLKSSIEAHEEAYGHIHGSKSGSI